MGYGQSKSREDAGPPAEAWIRVEMHVGSAALDLSAPGVTFADLKIAIRQQVLDCDTERIKVWVNGKTVLSGDIVSDIMSGGKNNVKLRIPKAEAASASPCGTPQTQQPPDASSNPVRLLPPPDAVPPPSESQQQPLAPPQPPPPNQQLQQPQMTVQAVADHRHASLNKPQPQANDAVPASHPMTNAPQTAAALERARSCEHVSVPQPHVSAVSAASLLDGEQQPSAKEADTDAAEGAPTPPGQQQSAAAKEQMLQRQASQGSHAPIPKAAKQPVHPFQVIEQVSGEYHQLRNQVEHFLQASRHELLTKQQLTQCEDIIELLLRNVLTLDTIQKTPMLDKAASRQVAGARKQLIGNIQELQEFADELVRRQQEKQQQQQQQQQQEGEEMPPQTPAELPQPPHRHETPDAAPQQHAAKVEQHRDPSRQGARNPKSSLAPSVSTEQRAQALAQEPKRQPQGELQQPLGCAAQPANSLAARQSWQKPPQSSQQQQRQPNHVKPGAGCRSSAPVTIAEGTARLQLGSGEASGGAPQPMALVADIAGDESMCGSQSEGEFDCDVTTWAAEAHVVGPSQQQGSLI